MFHLHPNISFDLAVVTANSYALPVLPLIGVWLLYAHTHLKKSFICLGWVVTIFLLEEMVFPSIELLHSGVFVAVIALSVFHMLAFFRIHILIYFAFKIIGYALRLLLRVAFCPLIGSILCVFMSPLVMRILIEEVVNPFIHVACQYNIHSFGLFVVGVSISCKILCLARRFFGWVVALSTIYFTAAQYPILWDILAMIGFLVISAATVLAIVAALESLVIEVKSWLYRLLQLVWRHQPVEVDMHPDPHHPVVDTPAPHHVFSITWSDDLPSSHLTLQPHTEEFRQHVRNFRLALCEISSIVKQVCYIDIDPSRREHFRQLYSRVDHNYDVEARAHCALQELKLLYKELKQQYPGRFRSWSQFEQLFEECLLFQQSVDIIFLEMKLRAEFDPNEALKCVRNTMEQAEEDFQNDHDEVVEEANSPPAVEAPIMPPQEAVLLPIDDNDEFQVNFDAHIDREEIVGRAESQVQSVEVRRCIVCSLFLCLVNFFLIPI